jgi:hypothetical protein
MIKAQLDQLSQDAEPARLDVSSLQEFSHGGKNKILMSKKVDKGAGPDNKSESIMYTPDPMYAIMTPHTKDRG